MNKYTVYFTIYGKKLKTQVTADSEAQAKQIVINNLTFVKIKKDTPPISDDDFMNNFKNIFHI